MAKEARNNDLRSRAKEAKVKLWQIAEALGISDFTLSRKLRHELTQEEKVRIFRIIDQIAKEV